jgi:hypothetical protein
MLDFSALTDDQLVELIKLSVAEAQQRNDATFRAAQSIGLDAAERQRIRQAAIEAEAVQALAQERAREREQAAQEAKRLSEVERWQKRGELARPFVEALGKGWHLNVWEGSDKRVYVEQGEGRNSRAKLCYYVTGNGKNPPGTIETEGVMSYLKLDREELEELKVRLRPMLEQAACWSAGLRLDLDKAVVFLEAQHA